MQNQVGWVKDNPLTRLADEVKQLNIERGNAAGAVSGTPVQVLSGGPMVRSAPMLAPRPLSPEETAELDEKARAMGIEIDEDVNSPPINPVGELPERYRAPSVQPVKQETARNISTARLPNFRNVDGFDLRNGVVLVDGMKFPLPPESVVEFKRYAMEIALDHVTRELASALAELGGTNLEAKASMPEGNGKSTTEKPTTEEVQRVGEGSSETVTE